MTAMSQATFAVCFLPTEYTALMEAAKGNYIDIMQLLVDNGADLEVARRNGKYFFLFQGEAFIDVSAML